MTRITTFADPEATAERAAVEIARALESAREQRGVAHLALSGGSTPARTYELLASALDGWDGVEIWFADERCVGPEDEESNYRLAAETLLRPAEIDPARVHRLEGELGPDEGARRYAEALRAGFASEQTSPPSAPALPVLDLAQSTQGAANLLPESGVGPRRNSFAAPHAHHPLDSARG